MVRWPMEGTMPQGEPSDRQWAIPLHMPGQRREVGEACGGEAAGAGEGGEWQDLGSGHVSPGFSSIDRILPHQRGNGLSVNLEYRARLGEGSLWEARVGRRAGRIQTVVPSNGEGSCILKGELGVCGSYTATEGNRKGEEKEM